ncbi:Uncharacterised protein [Kingella potus]|uniref:Uncharacterized protein n=1 Tax=Kingella potus TaxID=265175 RepID=A0A377R4B5_9NEIS|nr:hypothetical protein [Kingella potus]UOP01818.1 hypothetical protein LVJ84_06945 [Kingella potus]STR03084.1 Uncharacterised protein [Kingella potus]
MGIHLIPRKRNGCRLYGFPYGSSRFAARENTPPEYRSCPARRHPARAAGQKLRHNGRQISSKYPMLPRIPHPTAAGFPSAAAVRAATRPAGGTFRRRKHGGLSESEG